MRPRDLPKVRNQTLKYLDDPASAMRVHLSADIQPGLDALASHLAQGAMYWVRPDMTALAVAAGRQLAATSWGIGDRPSTSGLVVFEGGVGQLESNGALLPVDACCWGTFEGQCLVWLLMLRRTLLDRTADKPFTIVAEAVPPLIPVVGHTLGVDAPEPVVEMGELSTVLATLAAALLLMEQPTLIEQATERPDKAVRRTSAQAGQPEPNVTLVDLRRQYVPLGGDAESDGDSNRYRNRWVVSGHWRNQAWGPERALRRRQWIPSYVKGPDGAPLLVTERVNVWRR